MVLTEHELLSAITKSETDRRIRSALYGRRNTVNFIEQATCDREIQRYLLRKGTVVYKFNCNVVHQPWRFNQIVAIRDHGWDELGPTDERLQTIYRSLPIYDKPHGIMNGSVDGQINNLNKNSTGGGIGSRASENFVIEYDLDQPRNERSWGMRILGCIFA